MQLVENQFGGGSGIRTHGSLRISGFQDRCNQPLYHPSGEKRWNLRHICALVQRAARSAFGVRRSAFGVRRSAFGVRRSRKSYSYSCSSSYSIESAGRSLPRRTAQIRVHSRLIRSCFRCHLSSVMRAAPPMTRKSFLKHLTRLPVLSALRRYFSVPAHGASPPPSHSRVRPSDPGWPDKASWEKLKQTVNGRLIKIEPPMAGYATADIAAREKIIKDLQNPFYVGDQPGATQSTGWVDAWMSAPSVYAIAAQTRGGASDKHYWWAGDNDQVGKYWHGYRSVWLPDSLLAKDQTNRLVDALFSATRHWRVSLHFNKGLAGAPLEEISAARDTATNPAVLNAFALAIIAGGDPPVYPGIPGHEPDVTAARQNAIKIAQAMTELRKIVPNPGSYVSETNYFEDSWQESFWGSNNPRLKTIKQKYDPAGLFFVHHGVGTENWSPDGFTRTVNATE